MKKFLVSTWFWPAMVFLGSLALRLAFLEVNGVLLTPDSYGRYLFIAQKLFGEWVGSVHDTPGYPLFVALLLQPTWAIPVCQCLLSSFTVVLLLLIARAVGLGRWAILPVGYQLVNPAAILFANTYLSETLFTFLLTLALFLFVGIQGDWSPDRLALRYQALKARFFSKTNGAPMEPSPSRPAFYFVFGALGLVAAAVTLTRANGLMLLLVLVPVLALSAWVDKRIGYLVVFLLATAAPLAIWLRFNFTHRQLVAISQGGGWQFVQNLAYFGLFDEAELDQEDQTLFQQGTSLYDIRVRHFINAADQKERLQIDPYFMNVATACVKKRPGQYLKTLPKALLLPRHVVTDLSRAPVTPNRWRHHMSGAEQAGYGSYMKMVDPKAPFNRLYRFLLALTMPGKYHLLLVWLVPAWLLALFRRDIRFFFIASLPLGSLAALTLLLNPIDRYFYPFEGMMIFCMCYCLRAIHARFRSPLRIANLG